MTLFFMKGGFMGSLVNLLGLFPLFPLLTGLALPEIPAAEQIVNWQAPFFWTPPAARAPGEARLEAVSTATPPLPFIAVSPCRGGDTRGNGFAGQYGPPSLGGSSTRNFTIVGVCGVPASAAAVSFNFTVTNNPTFGDIRVYPAGGSVLVSTLNWGPNTGNVANAAVVPLSAAGAISVQVDGPGPLDLIFDINGYYDGSVLKKFAGSRRLILNQLWTPQTPLAISQTTVGGLPIAVQSDGADLWVANRNTDSVSRVRGSDGKLLETFGGPGAPTGPSGVLVAMGRVFVTGHTDPGTLYMIDPRQPAGAVTTVASNLGRNPGGLAFDGTRIWTANSGGSVSTVTPGASTPWTVTNRNITVGSSAPVGILFDGSNIWVTDSTAGTLVKLDSSGAVLQTVTVGSAPALPVFDGANIWVPNSTSNSVAVVRASTGEVVQTLTGNGLNNPYAAAFDGERILVTNNPNNDPESISLWRAADLSPLGSTPTGPSSGPAGACSDGLSFWVTFSNGNKLARF